MGRRAQRQSRFCPREYGTRSLGTQVAKMAWGGQVPRGYSTAEIGQNNRARTGP